MRENEINAYSMFQIKINFSSEKIDLKLSGDGVSVCFVIGVETSKFLTFHLL